MRLDCQSYQAATARGAAVGAANIFEYDFCYGATYGGYDLPNPSAKFEVYRSAVPAWAQEMTGALDTLLVGGAGTEPCSAVVLMSVHKRPPPSRSLC